MASISTDRYGNRTVQFIAADAKQRSIRLGKMPLKAVRAIKTKVEALNAAAIAGSSWEYQTSEWVGERDAVLYDKLAAVRLVAKASRGRARWAGSIHRRVYGAASRP
jgi:hypothetical protein